MKAFLKIFFVLLVIAAVLFWWLFLDARAPKSADGVYDLAAYRALVAGDALPPTEIRMESIGTDTAPFYAAEAGGGFEPFRLVYAAFEIVSPGGTIVVGGALDRDTAALIAQAKNASFDEAAYERLLAAIEKADQILITHEHLDHVMAIARHPRPAAFVDRLRLTAPQIEALPKFAAAGRLDPAFVALTPLALSGPTKIAPGVVAIPTPGHSPGSLSIYVRTASGAEYLMIGDIVWAMANIDHLRTRPRILQYLFFDPSEDREAVLAQVRALHDLKADNPDLVILPEHDGDYLRGLVESGAIGLGFK